MPKRMPRSNLFVCVACGLFCAVGFPGAQTATYTLSPKSATANSAFTLKVLSSSYDSCHYQFTHDSLALTSGRITASFVPVDDTACSAVVHPFGPSYSSPGYPVGKYAVYAQMELAGQFTVPACPVFVAPVFVDTLTVTTAVSVLPMQGEKLPAPLRNDAWEWVRGWRVNGRKGK